jgi:hypothetical protein
MKLLLLGVWLCVAAMPAFAQSLSSNNVPVPSVTTRGAPAPLVGLGIPAVLAGGGVLLGSRLLRRKR